MNGWSTDDAFTYQSDGVYTATATLEGGAMRGIFAAVVFDKFMEHDYHPFDFTLGVSAGATNLCPMYRKCMG